MLGMNSDESAWLFYTHQHWKSELSFVVNVCSNLTLVATSPNVGSELEQARPQTSGEEELQLQLALAMSREAAEQVHAHSHTRMRARVCVHSLSWSSSLQTEI